MIRITPAYKRKLSKLLKIVIPIFFIVFTISTWIPVTEHIAIDLIDGDTENIRIALITDLHSCYYGKDQKNLVKRINKEKPDIIVLAGDIFDDKLSSSR